jgi:hypothetical protein
MFDAMRRLLRRRRQVRADAEALLRAMPGLEGWKLARERGLDAARSEIERNHWWRVAALIECRAGIRRDIGGFAPPM